MSSENILHFNAVRLRVSGSGNLDMTLFSFGDVISQTLAPLAMVVISDREPRVLANFKGQRTKLRISTDEIDEYFIINRVIIFMKPLWSDFPG